MKEGRNNKAYSCKQCIYQSTVVCAACVTCVSPSGKTSKPSKYIDLDSPELEGTMFLRGFNAGFEQAKALFVKDSDSTEI